LALTNLLTAGVRVPGLRPHVNNVVGKASRRDQRPD
jgi:hypothetical protein